MRKSFLVSLELNENLGNPVSMEMARKMIVLALAKPEYRDYEIAVIPAPENLQPNFDLVDKYYQMDPEMDDLIYGGQLRNNMRVLVEDPNHRDELNCEGQYPVASHRLVTRMRWNRWTRVTQLEREDNRICFVGLYLDGTKSSFVSNLKQGWYVKKDSIPTKDEKYEECELWDENCDGEIGSWYFPLDCKNARLVCDAHGVEIEEFGWNRPLAQAKSIEAGMKFFRDNTPVKLDPSTLQIPEVFKYLKEQVSEMFQPPAMDAETLALMNKCIDRGYPTSCGGTLNYTSVPNTGDNHFRWICADHLERRTNP